jgi:hypothetical protein
MQWQAGWELRRPFSDVTPVALADGQEGSPQVVTCFALPHGKSGRRNHKERVRQRASLPITRSCDPRYRELRWRGFTVKGCR